MSAIRRKLASLLAFDFPYGIFYGASYIKKQSSDLVRADSTRIKANSTVITVDRVTVK